LYLRAEATDFYAYHAILYKYDKKTLAMIKVPNIPTPTVERKGYKSRYAVQETYESIKPIAVLHPETYLLPTVPVENRDFAWFLGIGTLEVELRDKITVQTNGQCEYIVKPGKMERLGVNFYKTNYKKFIEVVAPSCDLLWNNVLALMPMKNNTLEVKNNLNVFSVTATVNNTKLDPFGNAGVLEFNGNQSFKIASSTFNLDSDFAIEMWFYPTGFLVSGGLAPGIKSSTILELRPDSQNFLPFNCYFQEDLSIGVGLVNNVPSTFSASNKVILNSYNYLCIARIGNVFTLKLNGETLITINTTQFLNTNNVDWYIGGFRPSPPYDFKGLVGFMAGFRVSNVYRDGSIVPTRAFEQIAC
jgi:Concanavalin A-like lectin/glucanases superfamily